ncbi:hypothetical protein V1951_19360 [Yersinia sp. 2544 StPb PI]
MRTYASIQARANTSEVLNSATHDEPMGIACKESSAVVVKRLFNGL